MEQKIINMWEQGFSSREIARILNLNWRYVWSIVRKHIREEA